MQGILKETIYLTYLLFYIFCIESTPCQMDKIQGNAH